MIEVDWQETATGYRCNILNKYVLEVWMVADGWFAGVNHTLVKNRSGKDRIFETPEEAKAAAADLAQEMTHRDGLTDSDGN